MNKAARTNGRRFCQEGILMDLELWLENWKTAVLASFGAGRVRFMGIRGSRARGEAKEGSDIDAVLILDELSAEDLREYRNCTAGLQERDRLCGFVSGERELMSWPRSELFSFFLDTVPVYGALDGYAGRITREDVRTGAHIAAGGIYHACVHGALFEREETLPDELCKSAFFALRAVHYLETGERLRTRCELADARPDERDLIYGDLSGDLDARLSRLMTWSAALMRRLA